MVSIIGNIINDLKQDLSQQIKISIDLDELAKQLYPKLMKIYEKSPNVIISKNNEFVKNIFKRRDR